MSKFAFTFKKKDILPGGRPGLGMCILIVLIYFNTFHYLSLYIENLFFCRRLCLIRYRNLRLKLNRIWSWAISFKIKHLRCECVLLSCGPLKLGWHNHSLCKCRFYILKSCFCICMNLCLSIFLFVRLSVFYLSIFLVVNEFAPPDG